MRNMRLSWWFVVIFVAGAVLAFVPRIFEAAPHGAGAVALRVSEGLGEALIIAAILGAVVDRYAKLELATEVGEKIAAKIHGYYLPDDLKNAINKVNDFKFIESEVEWDIVMTACDTNDGSLKWRTTFSYDIVNITPVEQVYVHTAKVRKTAGAYAQTSLPKLVQVAYEFNNEERYRYNATSPEMIAGLDPTATPLSWRSPHEIRIPPYDKHNPTRAKHRFFNTVERTVAENDLRSLFFSYPAINGVKLKVDVPDGFEVVTSLDSDNVERKRPHGRERGWEWHSKAVFLNNQRVSVRHRRAIPTSTSTTAGGADRPPEGAVPAPIA